MAEHLPHDALDFDHLDFAQACELCDTLQAGVVALASWSCDATLTNRMAMLYGRAELRKHAAFNEYEQEKERART